MTPITATIITRNEERHIAEAIASLSCCDEVIVVDSGSSDKTREIAASRGATVIEHAWEGYSKQKNFAASQAQHDWILSLDADERISAELAGEIVHWKHSKWAAVAAMNMPRRAFYLNRWIRYSGWYPDLKTRLYHRKRAKWQGDFVHESMEVDGLTGTFQGDILHFSYRDWADHRERVDRYTRLAADKAKAEGATGNTVKLILGPPMTFLKVFFLQGGLLDGWRGAVIAFMAARYVFIREIRILR